MKNKMVTRILTVGLVAALAAMTVFGCGGNGDAKDGGRDGASAEKDANFTWWITQTDSSGQFYEVYEESPVAQFVNQQYWDVESGGLGTAENGKKLNFSFLVPISGSESENFNTMIGTAEYPEIMDLSMSSESPQALYEGGVLMDITEYVEEYMPNYVAYLDANPELKPLVQSMDEDGNVHYYALYVLADGASEPWEGTCYRRDWVVKYAEPTEYMWDWESDYVKENGHPAVTPLAKAMEEDNLEGWKENEVTAFEASEGDDPSEDYTDNVIFPSGTSDPLTISDWEWMLEAFDKAIEARGWADDTSAYGISIQYYGYSQLGDLTSSFGGGTGSYYVKDGQVSFDGNSENFKTYLECMQAWYQNGWLDQNFNTRAGDMFFMIDATGVNQGKVGMWCGLGSTLGAGIRTTCQDSEDQAEAYVMGAALPINDVYGGEEQMYVEPDALFQASRKSNPTGITVKAEGKDLVALFTFFNWAYTEEGGKTLQIGLSEEQYDSVTLDPDLLAENNVRAAYTESTDEEGKMVLVRTFGDSDTVCGAMTGHRMAVGLLLTGGNGEYTYDRGDPQVAAHAKEQWAKYLNTGGVMDYTGLLNTEESEQYGKINTASTDYQAQIVPNVIKGTASWEEYVEGFKNIDTDTAVELLQKYVDIAKAGK